MSNRYIITFLDIVIMILVVFVRFVSGKKYDKYFKRRLIK